jgi:glycosyltransferase involved in cell wall biosynthesis
MKLEYVVTGLQVGGAESLVCALAGGMRKRGHDVGVTSLLVPTAYVDRLQAVGIRVDTLGLDRQRQSPLSILRAALHFRRAMAARRPNIVHAHMVHANLFCRAALALQSWRRLICTIHSTDEGGRLRDLAYTLSNWASDLNTTISEAATKRFVEAHVLPPTTLTVHNGIDVDRFRCGRDGRQRGGPFRWIAVGRLSPEKDYTVLLEALATLPLTTLTIAGEGTERTALEALATRLGIAQRVSFLGVREDIPALLCAHDGYVLSSRREGFGLALAEAMASSLPVVATRSGGPVEVVGGDGRCGTLVPTGDPAALAEAMADIAERTPLQRLEMGVLAQARVAQRFDTRVLLDRFEEVYEALSRSQVVTAASP